MSLAREQFGDFSVVRRPATGPNPVALHFAHATGFNANTYALLFASLDSSIDVYAMDARGHGLSKAPANPRALRSWKPYVEDLRAFVAGLPRPTVLAGHSMGGTVSLELAATHSHWVSGLVLVDPVVPPPKHGLWLPAARALGLSRRAPIAQGAARRRMEFPSREAAVDNFEGKGAFRTWPRAWIEAYVEGGTLNTDEGIRLSCDRAWESQTFAAATARPIRHVKRLQCPTTLITREQHALPFNEESRDAFLAARPTTRFLSVEGTTHFVPMEKPEVVRAELERVVDLARSKL